MLALCRKGRGQVGREIEKDETGVISKVKHIVGMLSVLLSWEVS